ncbi:probable lipid phosphate phosphatase beta isoform X2 [Jatropha curcas]|uniref:probable lipid phosphate phosphatase beta isoform X2 n=1 Tax=Jatropha curcas TaxID=180498 RepID=UPI0018954D11|nr:probable lipid phosphate phosphatase beta isoform X2 [Jatropha curcas]
MSYNFNVHNTSLTTNPPLLMMATSPPPPPPPPPLRHLLTLDTKFSYFLHSLFHSYLPVSLLLVLELSADFRFSFPITLALCLSPLSPSLLPFLSPLLFGLLLDLAFVGLIKIIFRRARPPYNPNMTAAVSADNFSFPSGHASRVFFVAALVSLSADAIEKALMEFRASGGYVDQWIAGDDNTKVVGIVVLVVRVWAAMTAFSRVLLGRHFFLDVLAGACLGVFEGLVAFQFLRFEKLLRT